MTAFPISPLRMTRDQLRLAGHRGHSEGAPENTFAAFRQARALGGPGVTCETDLRMTRDGVLVLIHDQTVDRTTDGRGLVRALTAAELQPFSAGAWFDEAFRQEPVPRLDDALAFARENDILYQLELKVYDQDDEVFPRLKRLVEDLDCADRLQIASFNFLQLRALKDYWPAVPTVGLSHSRLIDPAAVAREARLDAINLEIDHFASGEALQLHEAGIAAFLHVPAPARLEALKRYGYDVESQVRDWIRDDWLDQIISNDVAQVARLKREALAGI